MILLACMSHDGVVVGKFESVEHAERSRSLIREKLLGSVHHRCGDLRIYMSVRTTGDDK